MHEFLMSSWAHQNYALSWRAKLFFNKINEEGALWILDSLMKRSKANGLKTFQHESFFFVFEQN